MSKDRGFANTKAQYCAICGVLLFLDDIEDILKYMCCGHMPNKERGDNSCFRAPLCSVCRHPNKHPCPRFLRKISNVHV
jgi:hypothetical protein